jgi:hypothetical protein
MRITGRTPLIASQWRLSPRTRNERLPCSTWPIVGCAWQIRRRNEPHPLPIHPYPLRRPPPGWFPQQRQLGPFPHVCSFVTLEAPGRGLFCCAPRRQDRPGRSAIGRARPRPIARGTGSRRNRERPRRAIDRPRARGPAPIARVGTCSRKKAPGLTQRPGLPGYICQPTGKGGWDVGSRLSVCIPSSRS